MISFYTIFLPFKKVHLTKDVGQIPLLLNNLKNYSSKIIVSKKFCDLPDESYLIKIRGKRYILYLNTILFLFLNRKKIDVLNLYHFNDLTIVLGLFYKLFKKKGLLLIKADFSPYYKRKYDNKRKSKYYTFIKSRIIHCFYKNVDIVLVEHQYGYECFNRLFKKYQNIEVVKVYNGIDRNYLNLFVDYSLKKNVILYVGNITSKIKNTNLLLDVISRIDLKDWKVKFIGKVFDDMKLFIEDFKNRNPHLKEKVLFLNSIEDRYELFKEYIEAKIVCLVSKSEGFPLVLAEAQFLGCFFISTDSSPAISEIINDERKGKVLPVNDVNKFAQALQDYINSIDIHEKNFNFIISQRESLLWDKTINVIDKSIKNKLNK